MASYISRISQNMNHLTKAQKDVANYFLYHLNSVAFGTVEDLSRIIGVSTATIIRFSKTIGYSGFSDLQKDAQAAMIDVNPPAEKAAPASSCESEALHSFHQSIEQDKENLDATFRMLDASMLHRACELLTHGKHIYLFGMRVCRTLSTYAFINWGQVRSNVCLIHNDSCNYAEELSNIKKNDVLVVFWVRRYNVLTNHVLEYVRKVGAKIILISDSTFLAGSERADVFLPCQTKSPSYQHSFVAPIALINYFTRELETSCAASASMRLAQLDELLGPDFFIGR